MNRRPYWYAPNRPRIDIERPQLEYDLGPTEPLMVVPAGYRIIRVITGRDVYNFVPLCRDRLWRGVIATNEDRS